MNVQVLRLQALLCVEHKHAHIRILDGTYRAHHRVKLQILHLLALLTHAGRIDQVEVHAILVVAGVDRVTCRAGDVGHDVALLAKQRIGKR